MKFLVLLLLIVSAHFSLTPFAPAPRAWIAWPFGLDSKPWLKLIGGLPSQSGSFITPLLAGLAGLGLLLAAVGLFWNGVPSQWWPLIVIVSAAASVLLFVLYFGPWAILPLILDLALLWGVLLQHWTVPGLRGG